MRKQTIEQKHIGNEPIADAINNNEDFVLALNWYNYNFDVKRGKLWIAQYMSKNNYPIEDINQFKAGPDSYVTSTAAALARLNNNGYEINESQRDKITRVIDCIVNKKKAEGKVSRTLTITIQKWHHVVADLEDQIDKFVENGYASAFKPYDYFKRKNITVSDSENIIKYYTRLQEELTQTLAGKTKDLNEAYSKFAKADLKKYLAFVSNIINDCTQAVNVKKVSRKPRKAKEKTSTQLVSKMKYLKESAPYKIVSIDPAKIVKAQTLYVFNTKYRRLGVYTAADENGLSVKGSSIINFDTENSCSKVLRKPEDILKVFVSESKFKLKKEFESIKAAKVIMNGRINEDIVILRAF